MLPTDPYDRVWDAFSLSATTADGRHDSEYWRSHTGPYAACVIRVPAASLQPDLAELRRDLARLSGVRLHPDHFLHIMVQELGFIAEFPARPDELNSARLEEFAQAAVGAVSNLPPFSIGIGGANSFEDAVFLDVDRNAPLTVIHERLFDLAAVSTLPSYSYLPHCTIAHYDGSVSPPEATAMLGPWRQAICGELNVTEIEIVTLDPSEPYPDLHSYAVIPLGM